MSRTLRGLRGMGTLAILGVATLSLPAVAARLTGELGANYPAGGSFRMVFECTFASGTSGPCTGSYQDTESIPGCNNLVTVTSAMSLTGLNLSVPGAFTTTVFLKAADSSIVNTGGNCSIAPNPGDVTVTATGTFDGSRGTFAIPDTDSGIPYTINGSFKLEADPPFPITVTSSINATTANAQANFQPRPQDAGTSQSVYVFALAPASRVTGLTAATMKVGEAKRADGLKTDPVSCVLAQVNSQGQLVAASASTLAAVSTGVLSSAGNAVTVLNNVSTPNVAGATMFVGYGTTSSNMINQGVNRSAVTVPGTVECRPDGPQTGWWWNTVEGGRGYSIERQGNNLFMAAYFYEADGRATWLVASGPTTLEGAMFTAPLYRCTGGVTLAGAYRANACATAGNVSLVFNTARTGTMVWPGGTVGIERFNIVAGGLATPPLANQPENGWWWSSAEGGRGYFVEWQGGTADIAGYMYDDAGNPIWYITVVGTPNPLAMNGAWWQFANGMTQSGPYRAATRTNDNVGPATIQFTSATTATMTLPGGRQIALTRFRF